MTAGQHEATATSEEQAAQQHTALYDPSQYIPPTVTCPFYSGAACFRSWTSIQNPTQVHLAEGKRHAELAIQHRVASRELREAEARACKNVPDGERDISPFYHREDIISVAPLKKSAAYGGGPIIGAEVVFASLPGMTAEWLQRLVDCHLARNGVMSDAEKMPYCPLAVPHVNAQVRSLGNGFAVDITSSEESRVQEILTRTEALTSKTVPSR